MENPIYEFKKTQKELAAKIRSDELDIDSYIFRHNHIAYCELMGRKRESKYKSQLMVMSRMSI